MSARLAFLFLFLLACARPAFTQEKAGETRRVEQPGGQGKAIEVKIEKVIERRGDNIWSAVVLATNVTAPKDIPDDLREFGPRMKRVFGYNQFEIIGSAAQKIDERVESWLVPSENFRLCVKARKALSKEARGGYLLSLQLFQEQRQIVETETKLAPGSPLFIRGPLYGNGQLIFVLRVF